MFDIGWSELLLVAVIAIVFVGPKDLPRLMRTAGQYAGRMRAMAREFQQSFEDMARESELDELRKEVSSLRGEAMKPLREAREAVERPLSARLPGDLSPEIAEAIREAEEIETFAAATDKPEPGRA